MIDVKNIVCTRSPRTSSLSSKEITEILSKYGHPPKNHMQPLTEQELSIVFEYLTQHNQVEMEIYEDGHDAKAAQQAKQAPAARRRPRPRAHPRPARPPGGERQEAVQQAAKPGRGEQAVQEPHPRPAPEEGR